MAKRSGKTFFNTDSSPTDPNRQNSLTELIARQFEAKENAITQEEQTISNVYPNLPGNDRQAFLLYQHAYKRADSHSQQGNYLNEVDGQTGNGLEHLLPSTNTRFGVAYQRLEKEISSIKAKIRDYELVLKSAQHGQAASLKENINLLKSRLATLERRFYKVSLSLAQVEEQQHPIRSSFKRPWLQMELWLKATLQSASQQLGLQGNMMNPFKNAKAREKGLAYQALIQTKTLLEAETLKANPNPEIVSTLIYRYEKALTAYEHLLQAKQSL